MPWFRRGTAADRIREEDAELAELLDQLQTLGSDAAERVETAVAQLGLGVSEESSVVVATLVTTSMGAGVEKQRTRAQRAGHTAMQASPAGDRFPRAIYAAGVLAESFAIRPYLDPETWAYVTSPWVDVLVLPHHGESGVGTQDEAARNTRAFFESKHQLPSRASRPPADAPWLKRFLDPANDERLLTAIAEGGIDGGRASDLLHVIRAAVATRMQAGVPVAEIVPRKLVDIAEMCRGRHPDDWSDVIDEILDRGERAADVLNQLMQGPYEDARASLWAYLSPPPMVPPDTAALHFVHDEVLPGIHSQLVLHSGDSRWRPVAAEMLASWGVTADDAWVDAVANVAAAPVKEEPWPDPESPVRLIRVPEMEGEWLGLLAHRRADAPPTGYVVALPFRGAALLLSTAQLDDPRVIPVFATLAGNAYKEASKFNDELCRQLLWLQADGTPVVLCDLLKPPESLAELPTEFVSTVARLYQPGGTA